MRVFFLSLIVFLLLPFSNAFASDDLDQKEAECMSFYEEKKKQSQDAWKNYDEEAIQKLEQEGKIEEAYLLGFKPFIPIFEISDRAEECGVHDERFYDEQLTFCAFIYVDQWSAEARKYMFENFAKPYCEVAFQRGDRRALIHYLKYHLNGLGGIKDYKKAVEEINRFVELHPESIDLMMLAVPIYRRGGYGLEQSDEKAFELIKMLVTEKPDSKFTCELSLYYRNGIGTEADEEKSDKWLAVYQEKWPNEECDFINFESLFKKHFPTVTEAPE